MNGRNGKQCRERWINHLKPDISKEPWSKEEDDVLIRAYAQIGSKWSEMEKLLKGRTENAIKNHWHSTLRKRIDVVALTAIAASSATRVRGDGTDGAPTNALKRRRENEEDDNQSNVSPQASKVPVAVAAAAIPPPKIRAPMDAPSTAAAVQPVATSIETTTQDIAPASVRMVSE